MKKCTMEISKDVFERAKNNHYRLTEEDENNLFDIGVLIGYGLYGTRCYEDNGKYLCDYTIGSTCD